MTSLAKNGKNALFIELESLCQTLWAFLSNFGSIDNTHSSNMVMSCDPRCKFRKSFIFSQFYISVFGKVTKFLVEKLSMSEVISKNLTGGGGGGGGTPLRLEG